MSKQSRMARSRLADMLPDYAGELATRLEGRGYGHLARTIGELSYERVSVADDRCGFLTGEDGSERIGALRLELDEEIVDVKGDRIVYLEIRAPKPARLALRSLTAAAATI